MKKKKTGENSSIAAYIMGIADLNIETIEVMWTQE
jgi:hypothetical protein